MKQAPNHIEELIALYYQGKTTSAEEEIILGWIAASDSNKQYFKEQMALFRSVGKEVPSFDPHTNLQKLNIPHKKPKSTLFWALPAGIAAAIFVFIYFNVFNNGPNATQTRYYASNDTTKVELPDGTDVTLLPYASVSQLSENGHQDRIVTLVGRAFFSVTSDSVKPFIVKCGNIDVQVLGTEFEVESDTIAETVLVSVKEGMVGVSGKNRRFNEILNDNEQLLVNQDEEVLQKSESGQNHFSWKTGVLQFESSPVRDVLKELSKYYRIEFVLESEEIEEMLLTTKIESQPIEEVIMILEISLGVVIEERNGVLYLKKN
jgi:ferric-dicitrate binding protein FerR (iron transport regulator)